MITTSFDSDRDEGTSYHYAAWDNWIDVPMADDGEDTGTSEHPVRRGKT